ncbi:MAG TPA: hypothetical protein VL551_02480 [Actinospica sp.]|nr:hypothetical protein [Actinospica sp.]
MVLGAAAAVVGACVGAWSTVVGAEVVAAALVLAAAVLALVAAADDGAALVRGATVACVAGTVDRDDVLLPALLPGSACA